MEPSAYELRAHDRASHHPDDWTVPVDAFHDLGTATDITLIERRDGTGTIMFGRPVRQGRAVHLPPEFEMIPNAKAVYDLVRSRVPTR